MDRLRHAHFARLLIGRCGGLVAAEGVCRVGKTQLGDYQSPHGEGFMPADVIVDLERYCGEPIYSRALLDAQAEAFRPNASLIDAAMNAVEATVALQRAVRMADAAGLSNAARLAALNHQADAHDAVRDIGRLLGSDRP